MKFSKLNECIMEDCHEVVGIFGMYCKEHTPEWEYPIIEISTKWPFIRRIKNKEK